MSARTSICKALAEKFKTIDGTAPFVTNIYGNAYTSLRFWDEVQDFPCIYMSAGTESREYHPGGFKWGYINIALKLYSRGEDSALILEDLISDVETVIDANRNLTYDEQGNQTTEILITSITTDEGLLAPYGIGEMVLQVRYALP